MKQINAMTNISDMFHLKDNEKNKKKQTMINGKWRIVTSNDWMNITIY